MSICEQAPYGVEMPEMFVRKYNKKDNRKLK